MFITFSPKTAALHKDSVNQLNDEYLSAISNETFAKRPLLPDFCVRDQGSGFRVFQKR